MTFAADMRHWPTIDAFTEHLAAHDPAIAGWAQGICIHHTYRPLPKQWLGGRSMRGLRDFYVSKGWTAGPHLFLVVGAPNPAHDGIWQLSPLNLPAVHARSANATHWGIEVVGDYDRMGWPARLGELVYGVGEALLRWRGIEPTTTSIIGHAEVPQVAKSCPGRAISMAHVRAVFIKRMFRPAPGEPIDEHSAICAAPRCSQEQAAAFITSRPHDAYTSADLRLVIIPAYFEHAALAGVDPCIALAQCIHETGNFTSFWSARPQRNPAGLGVTGEYVTIPPENPAGWAHNPQRLRWEWGLSFPSWAGHSIPAHIGRLLAYATRPDERSLAQQREVDAALVWRGLPAPYHGVAPTLAGLSGTWAEDGQYAEKIAAIANAMREY